MEHSRTHQARPVGLLSIELVQAILFLVPNIPSLQAVTSSCRLFNHAFRAAENTITTHVLLNQIDRSVLPEAIAAFQSSTLDSHGTDVTHQQAILAFVANLHERSAPPQTWPLRRAIPLGQFHQYVHSFARRFISETMSKSPINQSVNALASDEKCRVERALYRFEIYCNVFRKGSKRFSNVIEDQNPLFFAKFAPWENEQLGCIHDFLVQAVSPAFNDIAEHDVVWGVYNVEYGHKLDSPYIQYILSGGLQKLFQIVEAQTYEERYKILYSENPPPRTDLFLHAGLQVASAQNVNNFLEAASGNAELPTKAPFFVDSDTGPLDIWRWAHEEESESNWVYQDDRHRLREWGYVMWNRSRLDAIGIFQEPWDEFASTDELGDEEEAIRQEAYMQNSWEQRERVHRSGGTGWWSWGDQSRVKWTTQVQSQPRTFVSACFEPSSIQAAREMLSMMKLPNSRAK